MSSVFYRKKFCQFSVSISKNELQKVLGYEIKEGQEKHEMEQFIYHILNNNESNESYNLKKLEEKIEKHFKDQDQKIEDYGISIFKLLKEHNDFFYTFTHVISSMARYTMVGASRLHFFGLYDMYKRKAHQKDLEKSEKIIGFKSDLFYKKIEKRAKDWFNQINGRDFLYEEIEDEQDFKKFIEEEITE
jgi:hypothetical protein